MKNFIRIFAVLAVLSPCLSCVPTTISTMGYIISGITIADDIVDTIVAPPADKIQDLPESAGP